MRAYGVWQWMVRYDLSAIVIVTVKVMVIKLLPRFVALLWWPPPPRSLHPHSHYPP